jgi:death-on-curing protein
VRYLSIGEVLELHRRIVERTGGSPELGDLGALESAVAQPRMTYGGVDLYPDLVAKAVALGFSLIKNHAFLDGNKRVGHAAMETFLVLNGLELSASVDESEAKIQAVASSNLDRDGFTSWVRGVVRPLDA